MTQHNLPMPTMMAILWPVNDSRPWLRFLILAITGSLLLTITAKVQIPFYPVSMTMQTFAILLIGATFGWRLAGTTVLLYLFEGALGLPVFANGGGLAYFTGPTAGFLLGFLVAAVVIGWLAENGWDRSITTTVAAMLIGEAAIFLLGVGWLASFVGLAKATTLGFTPFIFAEVLKIALVAILLPMSWKWISRKAG